MGYDTMSTQNYIPASATNDLASALKAGVLSGVAGIAATAVITVGINAMKEGGPLDRAATWAWNGIDEGVSDAYHWIGRQIG